MKTNRKLRLIPFLFIGVVFFSACSKDKSELLPVLTTTNVSEIMQNSAKCGGNITSDGGSTVTARGVCWSTTANPTIANSKTTDGTGTGVFTSTLTGLAAGTTYYVAAYATNATGTKYGVVYPLTTLPTGVTVTDKDGNVYQTVNIGTQTWMAENLRTTKFQNGESISNVTDAADWSTATFAAWCDYDNNPQNALIYGRLYNWRAITESKNIAPVGWHVATHAEWTKLISYLGGESVAAGKLKEVGFDHWKLSNSISTNESGFTALPGGSRDASGVFGSLGDNGYWWTSTENTTSQGDVWYWYMNYDNTKAHKDYDSKLCGRSVRCVKDSI